MEETFQSKPVNCLTVRPLPESGLSAADLDTRLRAGDPVIRAFVQPGFIAIVATTLSEQDVETVIARLREACGAP